MTVYVEVVLLENIVVDCVLLWLVLKTLNKKPNLKNIFISALFGAVFALLGAGVWFLGFLPFR